MFTSLWGKGFPQQFLKRKMVQIECLAKKKKKVKRLNYTTTLVDIKDTMQNDRGQS